MGGRRLLGLGLVLGGLALVGTGVVGLAGVLGGTAAAPSAGPVATPQPTSTGPGSSAAASPSAAPTAAATAAPTVPPTVAPTVAPTAQPTADPLALIRAFFARLEAAVRDGNQESVAANLGGATIDRYGVSTCEAYLASRDPSPEQRFEILSISGPAPWDYVTDGLTTTVPDAYTVEARVTGPNASGQVATSDAALHVQLGDGMVFWFTDCGEPLPR